MHRLLLTCGVLMSLAGFNAQAAGVSGDGLAIATRPFTADFTVTKAKLPLGETHFSLRKDTEDGCYVYRGTADPNAFVNLFLGDIDETSRFCIVDGIIRPQRFSHAEKGEPRKSYTLVFDWNAGKAHYDDQAGRRRVFDIEPGVVDPLSLQIAARAWIAGAEDTKQTRHTFALVDDDGVSSFVIERGENQRVDTPAGRYDTIRIARVKKNRPLELWLARKANYIPVQVTTGKSGKTFTMKATGLDTGR